MSYHVRVSVSGLVAALLLGMAASELNAQSPAMEAARQAIARAIDAGDIGGAQHGDYARYRPALARVYRDSTRMPLWIDHALLTPQGGGLVRVLASAATRGLRAADYDVDALVATLADGNEPDTTPTLEETFRLDARLTLAAMRFMDHVHRGRIDPRSLHFALGVPHTVHDLAPLVVNLSRASSVHATIDSLEPRYERFRALTRSLARYRSLLTESTLVAPPASPVTVRPGDTWSGVDLLTHFLVAVGDLPGNSAPATGTVSKYDGALVDGVRRFQRRHGLPADGVLGRATMSEMRVPAARRVAQIELAMERWRWLPDITATRFIVVNIPSFRLLAFDRRAAGERPVERMDVIVGSAYGNRHTPVFTGTMRSVVFQPYWDVPPSIARREEVPRIRRDAGYASRQNLEIVNGGDVGATIYPLTSTNLDRVVAGTLRLRQRPGPGNALGAVKFVFPNDYNVYLHGTPAQRLFAEARRDFSHGCIRTSDPPRLAEYVLQGQPGWDAARISAAMRDGAPSVRVAIDRPIPVYILYTTVVADDEGRTNFLPDIYGHDRTLARALSLSLH